MYIKQIIIQGFKSYNEQTVTEPFSPKTNVIVGRNGSGKSNFFAAIRFVLSDAYTQMGREERQALLHEGSGSAVMSAYVEIIFDNSDDRFPTGRHEVVLRRTIGLKKDEYTLDRKNASKSDVMNLLESAGFSRSNPYYIVPQGRVTTLTNMKDSERLMLLKEVAGTQVYEQRRTESLKIMDDTDSKRQKIDELLNYIEERLKELEEEKEELRGYQEKDRERRCLEYTIYHREQIEIANAIDQLEENRQHGLDMSEEFRDKYLSREEEIRELDETVNRIKQQMELLKVDKSQLDDERREHVKYKAQVELDIKTLTEDQEQMHEARERYEEEKKEIEDAIAEREEELKDLLPEYKEKKEQEQRLKQELAEADAARQRLYAKQGRNTQFRSKEERDAWLKAEIKECQTTLAKRISIKTNLDKEIEETEEEIAQVEKKIEAAREVLAGRDDKVDEIVKNIAKLKDVRDKLMDERKTLWRQDTLLDNNLQTATEDLSKADRALFGSMDTNTSQGLKAIRRIKKELKLDGCYGTLAELMNVRDEYRTAVEVTAGQSLFHYVVDNEKTATKVLELLNKKSWGRITFMPLNRLRPRLGSFPEARDALPMIWPKGYTPPNKDMQRPMTFDEKYKKAFEQVFGKTIICPDLNAASQYARSHGVSAITLAGDQADKKGALTGGYHDPRRSRLEAVKAVKQSQEEFERIKRASSDIKQKIDSKDQAITGAVGELQKAQAGQNQLENSFGPIRANLQNMVASLGQLKDSLERKIRSRENVDASLKSMQEQLDAYQAEVNSGFKKTLTAKEEATLDELARHCQELRKKVGAVSTERAERESRKQILEVELRENLMMRLDQLKGQSMDSLEAADAGRDGRRRGDLEDVKRELESVEKRLRDVKSKLEEVDKKLSKAKEELDALEKKKTKWQAEQQLEQHNIEKQKKRIEKSMTKRALLQEKAAECSRNIRDLGVLPDEAFEKYENVNSNRVVRQLHKVNEALKKFSHVNKKAFEQYNNFTKQRDTLQKRRQELDKSQASIEELIQILDQRKDEAIERTFRQVSKYFAEIFEKLVPAGRGRLVIQRKVDKHQDEEDESDEEAEDGRKKGGVENYTGVGISVSFNSRHDEQQRIQQLSGGQKSLCALALIFAIQQCDPAPFYLFDEVDANLDAHYRSQVAQMIKNLSNRPDNGQFICTTFRPELVEVADKHYGVLHRNKQSTIDAVTKEEALAFIQDQKV
ncbi:RecF/RecN/SMC [Sphaerosporella brunnea]|uniref:Structural maintenance of chromosomes protein n=1 Tax=Sphaerosporella brunnea TaxID=1250544 RepID=A0A5J5EEA6_9PEZI|nr:RecF/RecN/SMC [Sphaerosporella brunnea]